MKFAVAWQIWTGTHHLAGLGNCRGDLFVSCAPGNYTLQTGYGPIYQDPNCQSTHCELLQQEVLATLQVVRPSLLLMIHTVYCQADASRPDDRWYWYTSE